MFGKKIASKDTWRADGRKNGAIIAVRDCLSGGGTEAGCITWTRTSSQEGNEAGFCEATNAKKRNLR